MRGNFPARRLPRAWGRFRPLRAFLRRGFPSAREFPCPALAARLGPFPAPPRLSARGFGRFRPLRAFLRAVFLCAGICPALAARLGPSPAPPRLSALRFPSARGFFPARRLPRAWGRFRPLRAFLRRGFPLRGIFPARRLPRAWGRFRPLRAFLRRGFPLRGDFSRPGACRAPGAVSGPSAPFCAAVFLCTGIFPRPALAARLGPFPAPPRLSARGFPLRGNLPGACRGPFPAPPRLSARGFPLRGNLPGACRAPGAVSGPFCQLLCAFSLSGKRREFLF